MFSRPRTVPLVVVLGATGAGKSKLAIEIAKALNGEIISADSMQVYKGLDILTNKVTKEEENECKHHLISYLEPSHERYTVIDFKNDALPIIDSLQQENKLPIVVGGTNYYIESLLWDFTLEGTSKTKMVSTESSSEDQHHNAGDIVSLNKNNSESEEDEVKSSASAVLQTQSQDTLSEEELLRNILDLKHKDSSLIESVLYKLSYSQAYKCLTQIDPEIASKRHPKDIRKVIRALQYYLETGKTMSSAYKDQHANETNVKSGPMRYPNACILWVKCNQSDLDYRIDKRVDQMLEKGMATELEDFYKQEQTMLQNAKDESKFSYATGFLQNIGYKEFRKYLDLDEEQRKSPTGKLYFQEGIVNLKKVTRKYARSQVKWINRRFCSRPGPNIPKVYSIDSSDVSQWDQAVKEAIDIVKAYCQGKVPEIDPEPACAFPVEIQRNVCHVCEDLVCITVHDWNAHIKSKNHRYNVKKMNLERTKLTELLDARKTQLKDETLLNEQPKQ